MSKTNFILLFFFYSSVTFSQGTIINSRYVSGIWKKQDSPFYINAPSYISLHKDSSLLIEPGVEIIFNTYCPFLVEGKLIAIGNENELIYFHKSDTNSIGWTGIHFSNNGYPDYPPKDSSKLIFCKIQDGSSNYPTTFAKGGAIGIFHYNELLVENCQITNNSAEKGGAIYMYGAKPIFKNNIIENNRGSIGGAIFCDHYSNPKFLNNKIQNNSSNGHGGAIRTESSKPYFENNILKNNNARFGGGAISCSWSDCRFVNNIISNNIAKSEGSAIELYVSDVIFINNTICYNTSNSNFDDCAIYIMSHSAPKFYNCIIYNNTSRTNHQLYVNNALCRPEFRYCNIQGGLNNFGLFRNTDSIDIYENNIDSDPMFLKPDLGDFTLKSTSPCINKGIPDTIGLNLPETDLYSNNRILDTVDIGAYEFGHCQIPIKPEILYDSLNYDTINNVSLFAVKNDKTTKYYLWDLSPNTSKKIETKDTVAYVYWHTSYPEQFSLLIYGENNCGVSAIPDTFQHTMTLVNNPSVKNNLVRIYPNPCRDIVNFKTKNISNTIIKIEILTIEGKIICRKVRPVKNFVSVDISDFPTGYYFVIINGNNWIQSSKILKY